MHPLYWLTRLNGHRNRVDERFVRVLRIDLEAPALHPRPSLRYSRGNGLPWPVLHLGVRLCQLLVLDRSGLHKDRTGPSEPLPLREAVLRGVARLIPLGLKRYVDGGVTARGVDAF
jgi:hypothetical protein